ncbi:MAG TPA: hypothetical protein VMS88_03320 [Terriglobales bacterium]|nr:hypothetical protein [Terriglobales bacterium]
MLVRSEARRISTNENGEVIVPRQQTLVAPGDEAPAFALEAHTGERVRLDECRGSRNVALYFMRAFT